jgi:glycosyltransferase involved in cell wall biosynthesis
MSAEDRLRIAVLTSWFSSEAGYAENCLSKALAAQGHEVHVVTSTAQPYFNDPGYAEIYEPWLGPPLLEPGLTERDGCLIHRLPMRARDRMESIRMRGMVRTLRAIRPDVVQCFEDAGTTVLRAALARPVGGYRLFIGSHNHASVFPAAADPGARVSPLSSEGLAGRVIGHAISRCYAISPDAADIAVRFQGIPPEKVEVRPLGMDDEVFRPLGEGDSPAARERLRAELGFSDDEVVCIYTGRLTAGPHGKNPLCLADAVAKLAAAGEPYRALFVGGGDRGYVEEIASRPGTVVRPFVGYRDLAAYYWAADVGVWPRQESTSQVDAAACGLPLVLSDRVQVRERVEGSGLTYREDDSDDLARALLELSDGELRRRLGATGAKRMHERYGWSKLARDRVADYAAALGNHGAEPSPPTRPGQAP